MKGIFTALMVAFDEDGKLDSVGTREIVKHNLNTQNIDGLYVNGSTGENFLLSTAEKKEVFKIVKEEVGDAVTLIAQIGSNHLNEAIELAKYATELGYDALSAVTPYYYKFDFQEIKDYYHSIVDAVDNEMIIYLIPALTGVDIDIKEFSELFAHEKIVGVKFTTGDFYLLERMRKEFPEQLIYAGFDEMLLPATVLGIDGAIGSTYNINGKRAKQIYTLAKEGRIEEARDIQHDTNDLITALLENGLYQTIKEVLKENGVAAGYCRPPMKKLAKEQLEQAKHIAKTLVE